VFLGTENPRNLERGYCYRNSRMSPIPEQWSLRIIV
jgi:hypothetical protein